MEIKIIENEDFMSLAELTVEMYQSMNININAFQAISTLTHMINNHPEFVAIGLYEDGVLLGFVFGYEGGVKVFHFAGIYTITKNNERVQKLIEFSFDWVENRGYMAWEADATNKNISSILEKYGAETMYIRYRKDLTNG